MAKSVKQQPELKKKVFSKKLLSNWRNKQGFLAENKASAFLTKQNYQILERNLRFKNHELDLIALDLKQNEYVFFEIKWRRNDFFGDGSLAVNWRKLQSMQLVAKKWLIKQEFKKAYRFDIISLVGNLDNQDLKIRHFKNVTWL